MELVMPNNFIVIEEEEMLYLDGGDWNNFASNIRGLAASSAGLRIAMREVGLINKAGTVLKHAHWALMAKVGSLTWKIYAVFGVVGIIATVGAGVAL